MVNRVTLIGRLGRDPELRYSPSGSAYAKFSLATDENRKDQQGNWQQETTWHNITVVGPSAERAAEMLKKGSLVYLEGRISQRQWEDQEGQKKTFYDIVCNIFRNLTPRGQSSESSEGSGTSPKQPTHEESGPEEDLPF